MKEKEDDLVVLNHYENAVDANVIAGMLKENGIPCMIQNETASLVLEMGNWSKPRILVFRRNLDAAKKLIEGSEL